MNVVTGVAGNPAEGYQVVGDIVGTAIRQFKPEDSAMDVAIEMVTSHVGGAPVVGEDYEFLGFINEGDVIRAIDKGMDLKQARGGRHHEYGICGSQRRYVVELCRTNVRNGISNPSRGARRQGGSIHHPS